MCLKHLWSWHGDESNPRYQEIKKIQERLSDYLSDHLQPVEQVVTVGSRVDDKGEPYFEVGILPEWLDEAKKKMPHEFEGIPVGYHAEGPLKKLKSAPNPPRKK